jgi:hypothetical protein
MIPPTRHRTMVVVCIIYLLIEWVDRIFCSNQMAY